MRAIVLERHGGPDQLRLVERPSPVPGEGEVLVRARSAAINFPDLLVLRGAYQFQPPLPFSPGKEVAGVVAAVGPGGEGWKVNDRVWASVEHGGYAEEVVARAT